MRNRNEVIEILRSSLPKIERCGIQRIGLFGSYARGEQADDSDIDILIEFIPGKETFENLFKVHELLKETYNKNIDLVTMGGLSPYIGPHILEEVIFIDKAPA